MMTGRLLAPVYTLGPGPRVVLWTQGCSKNCKGCITPELQLKKKEKEVPIEFLVEIIRQAALKNQCKGLTISGGDPLEQPEELLKLLKLIRKDFEDIMVYTGFLYEEIANGSLGREAQETLNYIDVLIDGPYVEAQNVSEAVLKGSENQRILYLNPLAEQFYIPYLSQGRLLQNFHQGSNIVTVGIPDRRFTDEESE